MFFYRHPVQLGSQPIPVMKRKQVQAALKEETADRRQQDHGFIAPPTFDMHDTHPYENELQHHSELSQPVMHEKEDTGQKFVDPEKDMGTMNMLFSNGKGAKTNFIQGIMLF